ncbi:hypothetical protein [Nitrosomonas ureae]|uniref:Uncharacterized protein n=1 Tax=Nitrosomonas ureae TaxID=44577 RepID=A0A1H8ZQK1_9PROT|nr:hypothetical protein [Nitrosomonas ureae]PXX18411.1 hypothetical protein C8R27_101132 [Nitrosomonas ureae]SEP66779.1 hypothetical protein SAMN05421510_1001174 [Nitrosomonas ureae]
MNKHKATIHSDNQGYEVLLEICKLYEVLSDEDAEKHGQVRVIDEAGKDYLYPITAFLIYRQHS